MCVCVCSVLMNTLSLVVVFVLCIHFRLVCKHTIQLIGQCTCTFVINSTHESVTNMNYSSTPKHPPCMLSVNNFCFTESVWLSLLRVKQSSLAPMSGQTWTKKTTSTLDKITRKTKGRGLTYPSRTLNSRTRSTKSTCKYVNHHGNTYNTVLLLLSQHFISPFELSFDLSSQETLTS